MPNCGANLRKGREDPRGETEHEPSGCSGPDLGTAHDSETYLPLYDGNGDEVVNWLPEPAQRSDWGEDLVEYRQLVGRDRGSELPKPITGARIEPDKE